MRRDKRSRGRMAAVMVGLLGALHGCAQNPAGVDMEWDKVLPFVAVWPEPEHATFQPPGEDERPKWWQTFAVVTSFTPKGYVGGVMDTGTLYLGALPPGQNLTTANLSRYARFAVDCAVENVHGKWLYYPKTGQSVFVFSCSCAGTMARAVMAFVWDASYGFGGVQSHHFSTILEDGSRLPACLGDFDGDGDVELFIATDECNGTGAPEAYRYRVIRFADHEAKVIAEVDESVVLKVKGLEALDPSCPPALHEPGTDH
ncbi:MAG: hypothetical protein NTV86_14975 [Planctomycetota bacterium]|nr:hypothetical protein [Planctomycetota bacterium]